MLLSCGKESENGNIEIASEFIAGTIYTHVDVDPDGLLWPQPNNNLYIQVDLFDDKSKYFTIKTEWEASHPGIWEEILIYNNSGNLEVAIDTSLSKLNSTLRYTKVFSEGDTISSEAHTWLNSDKVHLYYSFNGNERGPWVSQTDKYIGVRNIIESDTVYSWVRFSNSKPWLRTLLCHDYSYVKVEQGN